MFKTWPSRHLMLFVSLIVMFLFLIWRDVLDSAKHEVNGVISNHEQLVAVHDVDLKGIKAVTLERENNNSKLIYVNNLKIENQTASAATLSLQINSLSDENEFPSLRVAVLSSSGQVLRLVNFRPSDYEHSGSFSSNRVELSLPIKAGDASFNVTAYYE
jgi:hypothetical protein